MRRNTLLIAVLLAATLVAAQAPPRIWDAAELASFELPLVHKAASPKHVAPDYYYRMPVRPVYKSYPIYAPGKEPAGYMKWLEEQEPEIVFDPAKLKSGADLIKAGELVFDAPIGYGASFRLSQVRDPKWYEAIQVPVTSDGIMPFSRYVVRKKGVVEVGSGSCLMCHARVMQDGTLVKGAQGNFPVDRALGYNLRRQAAEAKDPADLLNAIRLGQRLFFSMPWLSPDPVARVDTMTIDEIASVYESIPPGVTTRVNLSLFTPAQIPDLIGIADRKHLDHTGIVLQRSIGDLMRYVALVQGANSFDRFGDFTLVDPLPDPKFLERYSDEQLFALGRFLYSLKPPRNPNTVDSAARAGRRVFEREGCVKCHTPPLYTNNEIVPVDVIGTDPDLALRTRKGTGFYKVPSLKGVWYRSPIQHQGAVRSLEEWLDPNRPAKVPGHPFGLNASPADRRALIAFLLTL